MAKVKLNDTIEWFSGRIGDLIFRRSHTGRLSVVRAPDMSHVKGARLRKNIASGSGKP